MLRAVKGILFWFPKDTICPIVLYELGAWSMMEKLIWVGVHLDYERKQDVLIQTELVRPDVRVVYSLKELAAQVRASDFYMGVHGDGAVVDTRPRSIKGHSSIIY